MYIKMSVNIDVVVMGKLYKGTFKNNSKNLFSIMYSFHIFYSNIYAIYFFNIEGRKQTIIRCRSSKGSGLYEWQGM